MTLTAAPGVLTPEQIMVQFREALRENVYMGPHRATLSVQQWAFLLAVQDEILFGGASKGGKTDAIAIRALKYVDVPYYNALILDRSFTNLTRGDGIITRFRDWTEYQVHPSIRPHWDDENHASQFPSGAKITFGFIDRPEKAGDYKRANYQQILWEELTEHPPGELPTSPPEYYLYLFTRLARPPGSPIPLQMCSTSNPDGPGREWVKYRWGLGHDDEGAPLPPRPPDRHYIPSSYRDNPGIDHAAFRRSMSRTSAVTQAQLLDGDWDVTTSGGRFDVDQIRILPAGPLRAVQLRYRAWDKAGTDAADAKKARRAKFTVGLRVCRVDPAVYGVGYIIEDLVRGQWGIAVRNRVIRETAGIYWDGEPVEQRVVRTPDPWAVPGEVDTHILIEQEPADAGQESAQITVHELSGRVVIVFKPSTNKETRAGPATSQVNAGNVGMVRGAWNDVVKAELKAFPRGVYSDIVDCLSLALNRLALATAPAQPQAEPGVMRELPAGYRS